MYGARAVDFAVQHLFFAIVAFGVAVGLVPVAAPAGTVVLVCR